MHYAQPRIPMLPMHGHAAPSTVTPKLSSSSESGRVIHSFCSQDVGLGLQSVAETAGPVPLPQLNVMWNIARQMVDGSCGSLAVLHALCNMQVRGARASVPLSPLKPTSSQHYLCPDCLCAHQASGGVVRTRTVSAFAALYQRVVKLDTVAGRSAGECAAASARVRPFCSAACSHASPAIPFLSVPQ